MKMNLRGSIGVAVATLGLAASVIAPVGAATKVTVDPILRNDITIANAPGTPLAIGGSSFVAPLVSAALAQWNTYTGKTNVVAAYTTSNSGTGRSGAKSGSLQIGFSDFPMNILSGDDVNLADYVQVPVALGGVAIVFNIGNNGTLNGAIRKNGFILDGLTLGNIFNGDIKYWDDAAIVKLNPKLVNSKKVTLLPHTAIKVQSRTAGSGTTYMFTDYLRKVDSADFAAGTANAFTAAAATSSNSAALATAVSATAGSIGYVEYSYAVANNMLTAAIKNASGKVVNCDSTGISAGAAAGYATIASTFALDAPAHFSISNATGKTVYPIVGFSYAIMKKTQASEAAGIAAVKFLDYLAHTGENAANSKQYGQDLADDNAYVALPQGVQDKARAALLTTVYLNANN